jgi:hypothetical protein
MKGFVIEAGALATNAVAVEKDKADTTRRRNIVQFYDKVFVCDLTRPHRNQSSSLSHQPSQEQTAYTMTLQCQMV